MTRPRVLVIADYYLPGFRAGGPVRAISNTIKRLASDTDFFVVTRDHDADGTPYRDVRRGHWIVGAAGSVCYAPRLTPRLLQRCVTSSACDVIWLNSVFSRASIGVLAYRRMGWIRQPVLLAPRGEVAPGALALKRRRKAIGLALLRWTGCLRSIQWVASSDLELEEIRDRFDAPSVTYVPESVAEVPAGDARWPAKSSGRLRAVFASRVAPTKNLLFLLEVLARCDRGIHLDVIGPLEDPDYWARCRALMQRLPSGVRVAYAGEVPHRELQRRLSTYDVMILPTRGENFGHIIVEAWAAGCPVLVSDRTPWRQLTSRGLGWDVPLDHRAWTSAIAECLDMSPEAHVAMRRRVREHARRVWQEGVAGDASLRRLMKEVARPTSTAHTSARNSDTGSQPESGTGRDLVPGMADASDSDSCA
jgi:glycosyltransferase involved in cell wall biosynthesis